MLTHLEKDFKGARLFFYVLVQPVMIRSLEKSCICGTRELFKESKLGKGYFILAGRRSRLILNAQ